jgi:hypothetical protein
MEVVFFSDGFMVLDIDYYNNDGSVFLLTSDDDVSNSSIIWHARLGHIGQERMGRLAREGLIGNLAKVTLPICEHFLVGNKKKNVSLGCLFHCN